MVLAALPLTLPTAPLPASAGQVSLTCLGALVPVAQSASAVQSDFVLRHVGSSVCQIAAYPSVRLSRDGRRLPARVQYQGEAAATIVVVPPGALVSFSVSVLGRRCRPADTVRVGLYDEDEVVFGEAAVPACPGGRLSVSAFRVAIPAAH